MPCRVLLTTCCFHSSSYRSSPQHAPRDFRWRFGMPCRTSFVLRFLHHNIPGSAIREYPTRLEYSTALNNPGTPSLSRFRARHAREAPAAGVP